MLGYPVWVAEIIGAGRGANPHSPANKMSSNNEILLKKIGKKWRVSHNDVENGEIEKLGEFNTLEEAVEKANEFKKECEGYGYGVEYGLRIIT